MASTNLYDGILISIGTHRLFLQLRGVERTPGQPLVIFIAGAGDVASSYCAVTRVCAFAPLLLYDRTGLGRSEDSPPPYHPSATLAAEELRILLTNADLPPPYILVGHSYGAIIARECLNLFSDEITGMVLADGSTERQHELFQDPEVDINAVLGDLNFAQVTGLRDSAQLSREEWRDRAIDIGRGRETWAAEGRTLAMVCQTLGEKQQYRTKALGDRPLSIIRCRGSLDYQKVYEKGVEAGNGSERQREAFRRLLERWDDLDQVMQEEQLGLSGRSRMVYLGDCGHQVHLVRPDVVAQEVKWVFNESVKGRL
ncbi:putative alpha/beta hydrolase [Aspergillus sclerotioniger CBS 115572]|uniref:Putative alpha/beta hydrolase n=1 Tax=Aspergillus sclerotioniger CBS 115572 TaxID=1450535 RepID=A0A317V695_9EURO|nr:putative alpha/beta hydrolase [Aspergillus sclerotioniger CBS 115572]PWY68568.1 putative alpha/beta hydrolase [Aspergillus sclerotioniger CBS 115572]